MILISNSGSEPTDSNLLRTETTKDRTRFGKALSKHPFKRHALLPERKSHKDLEHGL
jgi:hypothetical protein